MRVLGVLRMPGLGKKGGGLLGGTAGLLAYPRLCGRRIRRQRRAGEQSRVRKRGGFSGARNRVMFSRKWPTVLLAAKTYGSVFYDKLIPSIQKEFHHSESLRQWFRADIP